ncbi:WXG100 family type VII secretion target [Actinocatenispora rupis]|uniref:WXG100 family type VII secretion target n=1 Tax=Actinocatenispora rupis TaxID=519421 RepID=A0A8J3NDG0_9ACTN|nr:WXG100 family type VII secretion target [Actinocatenispora rupis]GID15021.1 hypothetical protein Aru02nite_59100 [Actinocatenispora rupis]
MNYPKPAPANYDSVDALKISPSQIESHATSLNATVDSINGHMDKISKTWQGLNLGWAGKTKTEVDGFNAQWLGAVTEMFGLPADDKSGSNTTSSNAAPPEGQAALGKIQALVKAAAKTYATAEDSLCQNLLQYGDNLPGGAHEYTKDTLPDGDKLPTHVPKSEDPDSGGTADDGGARDYDDAPIKEHNDKK